jgi:hypothetical protein
MSGLNIFAWIVLVFCIVGWLRDPRRDATR